MAGIRKSFQGVWNIIRFNWPYYIISFSLLFIGFYLIRYLNESFRDFAFVFFIILVAVIFISLLVSFYVYDLSDLYTLNYLNSVDSDPKTIVNINAGFDETSILLKEKYPNSDLKVFDFYDPIKHTEASIKRARKAYPPFPGTQIISTYNIPLKDSSSDLITLILSVHEIRNLDERILFFKELNRILKPDGKVVIIEHLRDLPNFLAYNIGFFHFYSKSTWLKCFNSSKFTIQKGIKITPFISSFILKKNGTTS